MMTRFLAVSKHTRIASHEVFVRGTYNLTIYQHITLPFLCEIREYHDTIECLANGFIDGKRVFKKSLTTTEFAEQHIPDAHGYLLPECEAEIVDMYEKAGA